MRTGRLPGDTIVALELLLLIGSTSLMGGCDSEFVSPDGSVRMSVPGKMSIIRDERKLNLLLAERPSETPGEDRILGAFHGNGAAVMIVRHSPSPWEETLIARDPWERLVFWIDHLPLAVEKREEKTFNGRRFLVLTVHSATERSLAAFTTLGEDSVQILFGTKPLSFESWRLRFEKALASVVIDSAPTAVASEHHSAAQVGGWTGLWHGLTWGPRWAKSLLAEVDLWADENSGFGYGLGFVVGFIVQLPLALYLVLLVILGVLKVLFSLVPKEYVLTKIEVLDDGPLADRFRDTSRLP